jgi:hypothetical protein
MALPPLPHPPNPSLAPLSPCSSKYTWYNFVPLFLLNAFTRLANAYFLMVCVLQSIPIISITNGVPTSALPLGIVLLFDGTATAREDYKRHVDDAAANNSKSELRAHPRLPLGPSPSPPPLPSPAPLLTSHPHFSPASLLPRSPGGAQWPAH